MEFTNDDELTDDERAYWQETETRTVRTLSGTPNALLVRMSRAHWGCFDALIHEHHLTAPELVDMAQKEAQLLGLPFEAVFPEGCAFLEQELTRTTANDA